MQNVLLLLGGTLLAVAAVVFTVVSWGNPGVRAGILIVTSGAALGAAWPLTRRRLDATAETIAYIGLALIPLDAVAVGNALAEHGRHLPASGYTASVGTTALWAAGMAVLAAAWAAYGRLAPLRLPRPTAIVIAQIPFPLAAIAVGVTPTGLGLAFIATAAVDTLLLSIRPLTRRLNQAEREVAGVAGVITGLTGTGITFASALTAGPPPASWRAAAALAAATLLAVTVAARTLTASGDRLPRVAPAGDRPLDGADVPRMATAPASDDRRRP